MIGSKIRLILYVHIREPVKFKALQAEGFSELTEQLRGYMDTYNGITTFELDELVRKKPEAIRRHF